jgi:two-component system chemotaxis response regulator CheB
MTIRALLVDDSEFFLKQLDSVLRVAGGFETVATASNGLEALELAEALRPDLVTLDVRMPVMDGVTTLRHLMTTRPVPAVMVSSFTKDDSHLTFECLRHGAVDFVAKPRRQITDASTTAGRGIADVLRRAAGVNQSLLKYCRLRRKRVNGGSDLRPGQARRVILVDAGRSGLAPLLELLNRLPASNGACVIVSLDLPKRVVESFSLYLARFSSFVPSRSNANHRLLAGTAILVSSSESFLVVQEGQASYLRGFQAPDGASRERLVEAYFLSVAEIFGDNAVAILLSGTPPDTLAGLAKLVEAGGTVLVQSPNSAIEPHALRMACRQRLASRCDDIGRLTDGFYSELLGAGR